MIVTTVHVFVKPEFIEAFKEATIKNHEHFVKESGNMRFDILQTAFRKAVRSYQYNPIT